MRHMTWSRFISRSPVPDTVATERLVEDNTTQDSTAVKWLAMGAGVDRATVVKVMRAFFGR